MQQAQFDQFVAESTKIVVTDPQKPFVDLGLDSLGFLNLMMAVEARFGIELDPDDLANPELATPAGLRAYAASRSTE
jgi:acyl carrier protein